MLESDSSDDEILKPNGYLGKCIAVLLDQNYRCALILLNFNFFKFLFHQMSTQTLSTLIMITGKLDVPHHLTRRNVERGEKQNPQICVMHMKILLTLDKILLTLVKILVKMQVLSVNPHIRCRKLMILLFLSKVSLS